MNQDLMVRLFRAIEGDKDDDVIKVAELIIQDEKKKGHARLAEKLSVILKKNVSDADQFRGTLRELLPKGITIPNDKRNNLPLAQFIERNDLRHHMVLPRETEERISRIEKEYAAKERLASYGLRYKQKILLYGPPGCGKSMSAERIAWNLGLPFLKVRFDAIISSYLGDTASNLTKLIDGIKEYPCVLLLDEFDIVAKSRNNRQDVGEMHRVVNILLGLLENFFSPGILIATTNLEESIDSALFRRFDDIVEISKPDKDEISRLLKLSLSGIVKSDKIEWSKVIEKLEGLSAAIVVKVAKDAAKYFVIQNEVQLEEKHIFRSLEQNKFYY